MPKCEGCGKDVDEVCGGGYCRDCHKSVSWEDCITQTFEARNNLAHGMPRSLVKKIYPNAKI